MKKAYLFCCYAGWKADRKRANAPTRLIHCKSILCDEAEVVSTFEQFKKDCENGLKEQEYIVRFECTEDIDDEDDE